MAAREPSLPESFHQNSKIKEVPLSEIKIDRSYQRVPSQGLIDKIAENWDEVASELVLISDRGPRQQEDDGGLWLVNGQHRSLAARKLGRKKIWARVVDLSGVEDPAAVEANLRLKTNVRLGDRPLERFKAQLRAGDPVSQTIVKILARFDTEINETPNSETGINAVSTVESIYDQDDGALLEETLALLRDIYGAPHGRAASAAFLKGYAWFILQHAEDASRDRVVERMRLAGTEALYRRSLGMKSLMGGSEWMNHYRAILDFYNDGLRDKSKLGAGMRGSGSFAASKSASRR